MNSKEIDWNQAWDNLAEQERKDFLGKPFEEVWPTLANKINWERIYKVMKLLDWQWNNIGIPSVQTLQKSVFKMAKKAWCQKISYASGGFICGWDEDLFFVEFTLDTVTIEADDFK